MALDGQCLAAGGSGCGGSSISNPSDDLISSGIDSDSDDWIKRKLRVRATLSCSDSEICYLDNNDSLLCYDMATGKLMVNPTSESTISNVILGFKEM